jgi:hypothetical protein
MKLRKVVLFLVFAAVITASALADAVDCVSGIGWTDECGQFHCSFSTYSGTCLLCAGQIDVKG